MKLITLFIMNIEFVLFLTDDSYALQYGVYVKHSRGSTNCYVNLILHNIYNAAIISHYNNIFHVQYYENGLAHCLSGPASIVYYPNGTVHHFSFHVNGKRDCRYTLWMFIWNAAGSIIGDNYIHKLCGYEKVSAEFEPDARIIEIRNRKNDLWSSLQNALYRV